MIDNQFNTYFGDANLDGEFNTRDMVVVFVAGQYEDESSGNSTWTTGDWNGDAEFNSSDLVVAFADGGYEQGVRGSTATAVPEPLVWGPSLGCFVMASLRLRSRATRR